jgi:hypothetical protein
MSMATPPLLTLTITRPRALVVPTLANVKVLKKRVSAAVRAIVAEPFSTPDVPFVPTTSTVELAIPVRDPAAIAANTDCVHVCPDDAAAAFAVSKFTMKVVAAEAVPL